MDPIYKLDPGGPIHMFSSIKDRIVCNSNLNYFFLIYKSIVDLLIYFSKRKKKEKKNLLNSKIRKKKTYKISFFFWLHKLPTYFFFISFFIFFSRWQILLKIDYISPQPQVTKCYLYLHTHDELNMYSLSLK